MEHNEFHSVSFCGFCGVCCILSALGNAWKKEMCFNWKYSALWMSLFLSIAVASPERWQSLFLIFFNFNKAQIHFRLVALVGLPALRDIDGMYYLLDTF